MPLVIAVSVTIGVGGFLVLRRYVPSVEANADGRSLSSAFSMSAGLFSFVLAFTIGQLYSNFNKATGNAKQEATAIEQVLRGAHGLPEPLAGKVRAVTLAYAAEVRDHEWSLMAHGKYSVAAWKDIDRLYALLRSAPANTVSARVDSLVTARQTRLDDANLSVPTLFKILLLLGAVLALFGTFYFKPFGERIQVVMIGASATLVGIAFLVAITLDYPYSGSVAVSKAPFAQSTLLLLSGG